MGKIFFFSGTGNSLYVAKKLAEALDMELCSIVEAMKDPSPVETDVIGIVGPVYSMSFAPVLMDFIKQIKIKNEPYIFLVATMGAASGTALGSAGKLLAKKGRNVAAGYEIALPDSSLVFTTPPEKQKGMWEELPDKIAQIVEDVQMRKKNTACIEVNPFWSLAHMAGMAFMEKIYKVKKKKVDTDKCISCGNCEKVCPVDSVKINDAGYPEFGEECTMCFACAQWCPVHAISLGRLTPDDKSCYRNPYLRPADMERAGKK